MNFIEERYENYKRNHNEIMNLNELAFKSSNILLVNFFRENFMESDLPHVSMKYSKYSMNSEYLFGYESPKSRSSVSRLILRSFWRQENDSLVEANQVLPLDSP